MANARKRTTRHAPDGRVVDSPLEGLTLHVVKDFGRIGASDVQEVKRRLRLLARSFDPETDLRKMERDARRVLQEKGIEPVAARLDARPRRRPFFTSDVSRVYSSPKKIA
jgi:hypothetical protein